MDDREADGSCSHSPVDCDDGNPCTIDRCDAMLGCTSAAASDPVACDDANACTSRDTCAGGACVGEAIPGCCSGPEDCIDADLCTEDACIDHKCVNSPLTCTTTDACGVPFCDPALGECATAPLDCDDGNACTLDTCDAGAGCASVPVSGTPCDDGDPATGSDSCVGGVCSGIPVQCEPNRSACNGECVELQHDRANCGACGNACDTSTACLSGVCVFPSIQPGGSPGSGPPALRLTPAGTLAFRAVSVGETSPAGSIVVQNTGGSDLVLAFNVNSPEFSFLAPPGDLIVPPGGILTFFVWFSPAALGARTATLTFVSNDPGAAGLVLTLSGMGLPPAGEGCFATSDCDDANACTNDSCTNFACVNDAIACDDGNACTADSCDVSVGCEHLALSGAACDDGDPDTAGDVCNAGACAGTPIACPPGYVVLQDGTCACAAGTVCDGACVVLSQDSGNCGACGNACGSGAICVSGSCISPSIVPGTPGSGPPTVQMSPAGTLAFGSVAVGTVSPARAVVIRNAGGSDLLLTLSVNGPEFPLVLPPGELIVPPGGTLSFYVRFTPSMSGTRTSHLSVSSNDPARPGLTLALSGTGALP